MDVYRATNEYPITVRPRLMDIVRYRLGGILILIGTSLQGAHSVKTAVPTESTLGPAAA
jgi:hypothetical protein